MKNHNDLYAQAHALCEHASPTVMAIVHDIARHGGAAYLVGGAVRDLVLQRPVNDIDIEVHHLTMEQVENILKVHGAVYYEGKSFGVLRVHNVPVEWALPRTDSSGRKPTVTIDPTMSIVHAARRRDLTMNALYLNLHTGELVDPYGGVADMRAKILRTPDTALFVEDPLRLFRVMHFMGRFDMTPDEELSRVCATMSVAGVARERIAHEYEKLLLLSQNPSVGFRWLQQIGRLAELLPELHATCGIPQRADYHPEGDVFEHLMQTVDAAAHDDTVLPDDRLTLLYAALCHDLGKVTTTIIDSNGVLRSPGHAQAGVPFTRALLKRMVLMKDIIDRVCVLVNHHMDPGQFIQGGAKPPAYRRLAHALAPEITMTLLACLVRADRLGRNGTSHHPLQEDEPVSVAFLARARAVQVDMQPVTSLLQGRDIADIVQPGPKMGEVLTWAYAYQVEHGIDDRDELKKIVVEKVRGSLL